jgi:hypothetical protein
MRRKSKKLNLSKASNPPNSPNIKHKKEKQSIYFIIKRLYEYLKTHPASIYLKKIKGSCVGYYDDDDETITIDYRCDFIPTLIHEFIHHMHPKWKENIVIREEKRVMKHLTGIQCRNILRVMVGSLY